MWRIVTPALIALTLAACGSSETTSSSSSTTSTASTAGSGTSNRAGSSTAASGRSGCAANQLRLAYAGTEGATGHLEITFAVHNVSSTPCKLEGYPAARLLSKSGAALPLKIQRGGGFFPDSQRRPGRWCSSQADRPTSA